MATEKTISSSSSIQLKMQVQLSVQATAAASDFLMPSPNVSHFSNL